jgi:hypothetical protein
MDSQQLLSRLPLKYFVVGSVSRAHLSERRTGPRDEGPAEPAATGAILSAQPRGHSTSRSERSAKALPPPRDL